MNKDRYLRSEVKTTEVWRTNIDEAMIQMEECLERFPLIAFDTEYPGTIYRTFIVSDNDERYIALKANVESTKLIQFGFTLFNSEGEIGGTWEINFSNFGDPSDARNESSIQFLKNHGLDFDKIRNEGVDMFCYGVFPKLMSAFKSQENVEFVTFHGAYDFAYILCILNNGQLPKTRGEFASEVVKVFGDIYDVKVMAGFCEGLGEHMGLSKIAQLLEIPRVGIAHNSGSDSLMTALVFSRLKQIYEDSRFAKGMLYGIWKGNPVTPSSPAYLPSMCEENLDSDPSSPAYFPSMCEENLDSDPSSPAYFPSMSEENLVSDPSSPAYLPWMCEDYLLSDPSSPAYLPSMCEDYLLSDPSSNLMFHDGYVDPDYVNAPVIVWDHSGVPWMFDNQDMYVNQLNHIQSNTFAYPSQTPYAADYIGSVPNYYTTV